MATGVPDYVDVGTEEELNTSENIQQGTKDVRSEDSNDDNEKKKKRRDEAKDIILVGASTSLVKLFQTGGLVNCFKVIKIGNNVGKTHKHGDDAKTMETLQQGPPKLTVGVKEMRKMISDLLSAVKPKQDKRPFCSYFLRYFFNCIRDDFSK